MGRGNFGGLSISGIGYERVYEWFSEKAGVMADSGAEARRRERRLLTTRLHRRPLNDGT